MIKLTAVLVAVASLATPALAETNWTGMYSGLSVGKSDISTVKNDCTESEIGDNCPNPKFVGAFGGYRYDFGGPVVGLEVSNSQEVYKDERSVGSSKYSMTVEGQVGYSLGKFLPYASVGYEKSSYGESVVSGVGVDYAVNDSFFVGGKYQKSKPEGKDIGSSKAGTISARVGFKF